MRSRGQCRRRYSGSSPSLVSISHTCLPVTHLPLPATPIVLPHSPPPLPSLTFTTYCTIPISSTSFPHLYHLLYHSNLLQRLPSPFTT
ncbi:hypothetical protein E2C01_082040 [Portunus trituberculatus]|uniref:Uncharacterized protein n=1 Tax=Portunus trituberculatus TaxID=210409 RepID=A0A5B7IZQ8_PORTR|nr:hypothetical protein [Portunus trituberculatus]